MLKWGFLVLNAFSLPSRRLIDVRFGFHWIKGSLWSISLRGRLRGRRLKGKGYGSLSPPKRLQLGIDENSNYFSFSQPPCDTKRPLRRREDRGGGGTAVVIQLGLREYKSCSDDLHLTAPAKKIPGVLHWRKSGTYRLWGVRLFTAFHSHNITSSNKLVMSLFIENRVKGILKINSIITRTLSTGKGLLSLITFQALGFITF